MTFRIVVDTREQRPWEFHCGSVRKALICGDYSVEGFEESIAIERKSLSDFTHTVIHDMSRFEAELVKLACYRAACVVVEADLDAVLRGRCEEGLRGTKPQSLMGRALDIYLRHGIPVFWCGSRQAACAFTEGFLRMSARVLGNREQPHA